MFRLKSLFDRMWTERTGAWDRFHHQPHERINRRRVKMRIEHHVRPLNKDRVIHVEDL